MEYNLLTEPWLKVKENNVVKKVGLREFFENATSYSDVVGLEELQTSEYEVYRFLITIFMDAYRDMLRTDDEIFDLYFEDGFDMNRMECYFQMCKEEGCTFDLLNKDRPFLQSSRTLFLEASGTKDAETTDKEKTDESGKQPAVLLCLHIPTASNTPFYGYIPKGYGVVDKKDYEFPELSLDEYAYWLIDKNCWSNADGGTMAGPISGLSTTILVKGQNVFETIVLNTPVVPETASVPLWRMKGYYPDQVDILSGMFAPVRVLYPDFSSVNEEKKTIGSLYAYKLKPILEKNKMVDKYGEMTSYWVKNYDPHIILHKVKKDGEEFFAPAKFKVNRRGFLRICDALGVTNEDNKKFEDIGKVIYSRNISTYSNRVRDSLGGISKARVAIYSSENNYSSVLWSLKQDAMIEFGDYVFKEDVSYFAYTYANWCQQIGKKLRKSKFDKAGFHFDDKSSDLFDQLFERAVNGQNGKELLEEARISLWKISMKSFENMKLFYHLGSTEGMKNYLKSKNAFSKDLNKILKKNAEKGGM